MRESKNEWKKQRQSVKKENKVRCSNKEFEKEREQECKEKKE